MGDGGEVNTATPVGDELRNVATQNDATERVRLESRGFKRKKELYLTENGI